jgi:hypothetical protein
VAQTSARPDPTTVPRTLAVQAPPSSQHERLTPRPSVDYGRPASEPLSVGQYIGMFLLMSIPIVNLIMPLVWAFGGSVNTNKKNFARAFLILCVATLVLWAGMWLSIGTDVLETLDNLWLRFD